MSVNEDLRLAQLSQLEREIRKAYAAAKSDRMRKPYKPRSRDSGGNFFALAAAQAHSMGVTADVYVKACFSACRMAEGPFVNMLGGSASAGWVKRYVDEKNARGIAVSVVTGTATTAIHTAKLNPTAVDPKTLDDIIAVRIGDIKDDLREAQFEIFRARNVTINDPGFVEAVAVQSIVMTPICRPILGGLTPEIRKKFGYEIKQALLEDQTLGMALIKMGKDVSALWTWLNTGGEL